MNSVACAGSMPAASQSITMSQTFSSITSGRLVVRGERVPVGDEVQAGMLALQLAPSSSARRGSGPGAARPWGAFRKRRVSSYMAARQRLKIASIRPIEACTMGIMITAEHVGRQEDQHEQYREPEGLEPRVAEREPVGQQARPRCARRPAAGSAAG